jgi:hypothetical protein
MLQDMVDMRIAILMMKQTAPRAVTIAVVTGTVRTDGADLVLDRGPTRAPLTLDEDALARFRQLPTFMRHLVKDAELTLFVQVTRLPVAARARGG